MTSYLLRGAALRALAHAAFAASVAAACPPASANLLDDADGETAQRDRIVTIGRQSPALTADTPDDARAALADLAGGGAVVDASGLETTRIATLADALRLTPGVFAAPRFSDTDLRLSIRGSGIARTGHAKGVLVFVDGVPVNQADGNFDAPILDVGALSHVTILRGGAALGRGASTLGGVIAAESRTGAVDPGGSVAASVGDFGHQAVSAFAGAARGPVDAAIAGAWNEADGYREQSATAANRISGNLGYRLTDDLETRLFASYVDFDSQWAGTLTAAELEQNPRAASQVARARAQDNNIRQGAFASRTVWTPDGWRFEGVVGWNNRFKDHATPQGILDEDSDTWNFGLAFARPATAGGFGLEGALRRIVTDQRAETFGYAGGLTSPLAAQKAGLISDRDRRAIADEAYVRVDREIAPGLTASGSLAYVSAEREDAPTPGGPANPSPACARDYDEVLPGLGLVYRPGDDWSVFLAATRTFEAPTFFDLGGNAPLFADRQPRLRGQTADTIEVGSRGRFGPFAWDATIYHARIDGELLRIDAAGALNPPIVNADATVHAGLELGAEWRLVEALGGGQGPAVELAGKYDWSDFRFDGDPVHGDNRIAGIPEHAAYGEARLVFRRGVTVRPNVTWRGRTVTDFANTLSADASVLYGLAADATYGPVTFWIDGRNLGDEAWVSATNVVNAATPTSAVYFPGDGRSVYAGVRLAF